MPTADSQCILPYDANLTGILGSLSKKFHTLAGTYTEPVKQAIHRLSLGAPVIRIFHQPNTLMGLNVLGLTEISNHLQHCRSWLTQKPVTLFLLLDYDSANDKRFLSPVLPAFSKQGPITLKGVVPNSIRGRIACAVPQPPKQAAVQWINQVIDSAKFWRPAIQSTGMPVFLKSEIGERGAFIVEQLMEVYSISYSMTQNNSFMLSKFVNTILDHDVLFLPASWLLEYSYPKFLEILCLDEYTISELNLVIEREQKSLGLKDNQFRCNFKQKGAWRTCSKCFTRRPLIVRGDSVTNLVGSWECSHCGIKATESLDKYQVVDGPFGEIPKIIPSVVMCDLLEVLSYQLVIGCHYAGGLEHLMQSKLVRKAIGIPLADDFIWDPVTLFTDKYKRVNIRRSNNSLNYGLDRWNESFRCGKFPAVFYWLLFDKYLIRDQVCNSAV